jgi:ubiquinone/menaquinone biosynthesis C-methylase UbiE
MRYAYHYEVNNLKEKGLKDIEHAMEHVETDTINYVWDYFANIEALRKERLNALNHCTEDMINFLNHYIPVTLPMLPFEDNSFDYILSAHFLFTYADRLDYDFHILTLNEMLRVSKDEIRIFPLVDLEGNRYEYLNEIMIYLEDKGCSVEEIKVPYEFQKHANSMLKIKKY